MSASIQDLQPKEFDITIKGVKLRCKPLRVSHALVVTKLGDIFSNPKDYNTKQIRQAQADLDEVIGDLVPELKGIELGYEETAELIGQMMDGTQPEDDAKLKEAGVEFEVSDPKVQGGGK